MTYNPATPNSTDLVSATQQPIKDNFFQLNTQFAVDHNGFNVGGTNGNGHHKKITFDVALGADPVPATATSSLIYPKSKSNTPNLPAVAAAIQPFFINNLGRPTQLSGDYYTYTPVLTSTAHTYNYVSQLGYYYIAGGVTFFFGTIVTSTETQGGVPPFPTTMTLTLPTTSLNFGTCTLEKVTNATGNTQYIHMVTFPNGSTGVTFTIPSNAAVAQAQTYNFSGFYI